MDGKKQITNGKVIYLGLLGLFTILAIIAGILLNNKANENLENKPTIADKKTSALYKSMHEYITSIKTPTMFDGNEENPIKQIFVSLNDTEDAQDNSSELMFDVVYTGNDGKSYGYTTMTTPTDLQYVKKKKAKSKTLKNKVKVFYFDGAYYWKDSETKLYAKLTPQNQSTKRKDLEKFLLSLGESKYQLDDTSGMEKLQERITPKYFLEGSKKPYSLIFDYTSDYQGNPMTVATTFYETFILTETYAVDYTKNVEAKKAVKVELDNGLDAFIDKEMNTISLTTKKGLSIIVQSNEEVSTEKLTQLAQSLKLPK